MRPKFFATVAGLFAAGAMLVSAIPVQAQEHHAVVVDCCAKQCCKPSCPPCIEYKGCPSKCAVEKIVTVCRPCGCTVQVAIKTPNCGCEKVREHGKGNVHYDYGRNGGVHIDWRDGGKKIVVRYHS